MSKAIQYMVNNNGVYATSQFLLQPEDITLDPGIVADKFYSCKDSDDTIYILCGSANTNATFCKVIKIISNGTTTVTSIKISGLYYWFSFYNNFGIIKLTRDETSILLCFYLSGGTRPRYFEVPISSLNGVDTTVLPTRYFDSNGVAYNAPPAIAIYRDLYYWYSQEDRVTIIDFNSLTQLTYTGVAQVKSLSVDINNQVWATDNSNLHKITFDVSLSKTTTAFATNTFQYVKQSIIDKWGDLILITNSGSTSTLIKINTVGTPEIINTIDLGGVRYNLNTDKDGTYFYSNNLNTWKIPANTAQGQAFSAIGNHTIIRGTGMTTYNNDITGYMVSSNSSVGC